MNVSTKANLYLLLIAMIWGSTFPLIRNAIAHIDPLLFVFLRFSLSALLMLPLVWHSFRETSRWMLLECLLFGLITALAYNAQTIGLQTISSAQSAFITTTYVIMVPFLAALFKLGKLSFLDILCTVICLLGVYILTGANLQLSTGEWWTLICAIAFAVQIVYSQRLSIKAQNYRLLSFYQIAFTVPFAFVLSWGKSYQNVLNYNVIFALVFCALVSTVLIFLLQTKYQKHTTPTKAALIFSMEPVFASIFGYLVNGEMITTQIFFGGLLIVFSITLPSIIFLSKKFWR